MPPGSFGPSPSSSRASSAPKERSRATRAAPSASRARRATCASRARARRSLSGRHAREPDGAQHQRLPSSLDQCINAQGDGVPGWLCQATPCLPGSWPVAEAAVVQALPGRNVHEQREQHTTTRAPGYLCVGGSTAPQPCPGGTHADQTVLNINGYLSSGLDQCSNARLGHGVPVGSAEPTPCLPGSFAPSPKQQSCKLCRKERSRATRATPSASRAHRTACASRLERAAACPGGTHANQTVLNISGYLSSLDQCIECPAGTSCSVGSAEPKPCLPGSFAASPGTGACTLCPAGQFQDAYGQRHASRAGQAATARLAPLAPMSSGHCVQCHGPRVGIAMRGCPTGLLGAHW